MPGTALSARSAGVGRARRARGARCGRTAPNPPRVCLRAARRARPLLSSGPEAPASLARNNDRTYDFCLDFDNTAAHPAGPTVEHTSALARRLAAELRATGWQLERVLSDNGNEFGRRSFADRLPTGVAHTRIRSGRPQTNGHVERLQRTILEECWRPAFARFLQVRYSGLKRHLDSYLRYYNHERAHTGRITRGHTPTELIYPGHKMTPR